MLLAAMCVEFHHTVYKMVSFYNAELTMIPLHDMIYNQPIAIGQLSLFVDYSLVFWSTAINFWRITFGPSSDEVNGEFIDNRVGDTNQKENTVTHIASVLMISNILFYCCEHRHTTFLSNRELTTYMKRIVIHFE